MARQKKRSRVVHTNAARQDGSHLEAAIQAPVVASLDAHEARADNPHSVTAAQVGAPPNARQVISGAGLTGGGDLSADRTLAVGAGAGIVVAADAVSADFGTGAGKVTEGNDARLSDARTPTDHGIADTAVHDGVGGAVEDNLVSFDANGLPKDSGVAATNVLLTNGVNGTFTTVDGKTVTVVDGQITAIV